VAGQQKDFGRIHLTQLEALFCLPVGKKLSLPYQVIARRTYEGLVLKRGLEEDASEKEVHAEVLLPIPGTCEYREMTVICLHFWKKDDRNAQKTCTKWFDYDKIGGNLVIRTRRPGDYLVLYRSGGKKKLKDYFIDEKIPLEKRNEILLLASGSEILWVIGRRVSEAYKVDKNTEQILSVQIKGEGST
jgi:tRNA(Ile)-lysidine synthase